MSIVRRELRAGLRSLVIWVAAVAAYNAMMAAFFPSFGADAQRVEELLKVFPQEIIKAFGLDRISMADPVGFYATEVYVMVILVGSIFAALLGSGLLAKEENDKTIEFLLAKPVSRESVLAQKVLAFVVSLVVFNVAVSLATLAAFAVFVDQSYSAPTLLRLLVAPFFAHLVFASLGFLTALVARRPRAVYSASIGLAVGTYFAGLLSLISDRASWLRWISPYRYVEASDIVADGRLVPGYLLALLAVSAAALAATFALYRRRDITI